MWFSFGCISSRLNCLRNLLFPPKSLSQSKLILMPFCSAKCQSDWSGIEQRIAENAFPLVISVVAYSLAVFPSLCEGSRKERTMVSAIFSNCNPSCLIWALQFCHTVRDGTYHCCVRSRKVSCLYSCGSSAERAREALGFGAEVCHSDSALQWLNQHHSKDFLLSPATFSLNESSEQQRSFSPGPLCSFCSFLFPYL